MSDYEGLQALDYHPGLEVRKPTAAAMSVEKPCQYAMYDQNGDCDALQVDTRTQNTKDGELCGLRRPVFWILVAISAIVVIAVGVGAGVGASMSHKNKVVSPSQSSESADGQTTSQSIAVSTVFVTSSAGPGSTSLSTATTAPLVTPSSSKISATSSSASSSSSDNTSPSPFPSSGSLAVDCPGSDDSTYASTPAGSSTTYTFQVHCGANYVVSPHAITGFNITTLDACMDKCANYNQVLGGEPCVAVTFQGNLTAAESPLQRANCWLAGTTSGVTTSDNELLVSAEITGTS